MQQSLPLQCHLLWSLRGLMTRTSVHRIHFHAKSRFLISFSVWFSINIICCKIFSFTHPYNRHHWDAEIWCALVSLWVFILAIIYDKGFFIKTNLRMKAHLRNVLKKKLDITKCVYHDHIWTWLTLLLSILVFLLDQLMNIQYISVSFKIVSGSLVQIQSFAKRHRCSI